MDMGLVRGLLTLALMILFIGLWVRSWSRQRSEDYREAERLPLEEDDRPPPANSKKEQTS